MSDPSTPDNAYYLNNLTTNSVEELRFLKKPILTMLENGGL